MINLHVIRTMQVNCRAVLVRLNAHDVNTSGKIKSVISGARNLNRPKIETKESTSSSNALARINNTRLAYANWG